MNSEESWHPCQEDGGWEDPSQGGGQGQHVGCEHFDAGEEEEGEEEEEEEEEEDKNRDTDDDGVRGQHMGRGRLCQHVASRVSQGNRPDRACPEETRQINLIP